MMKNTGFLAAALTLGLLVGPTYGQQASTHAESQPGHTHSSTSADSSGMSCADMAKMHEQMMGEMKEADPKLDALVEKMNDATGSGKIDKMAAVINELVAQRSAMMDHVTSMQPMMTQHMMRHMESGMEQGVSEMMANCPMMTRKASAGTTKHEEHH